MIPLKDENPTKTFPFVTITIIAINVLVFIYELNLGSQLEDKITEFAVIPYNIIHMRNPGVLLTLITSLFFHAGFAHVFGNMLYLWIFGNNIEDAVGHLKFVVFYLICGLAGSYLHILTAKSSNLPTIGASGAISGILGAYIVLYPRAKILALVPTFGFIRLVKVPAYFFLGFWILLQLLYGLPSLAAAASEGGVAWFGHIGGFLAGLILIHFFRKKDDV